MYPNMNSHPERDSPVYISVTFRLDSKQLVTEVQSRLTGQDKLKFKEDILEGIKEIPLSMKQKLELRGLEMILKFFFKNLH